MILPPRNWIYDIETYPNCFTFTIVREDNKHRRVFEISDRKNEFDGLYKCIQYLVDKECNMVGFNNLGFDYPVVHKLLKIETAGNMPGHRLAKLIYGFAMEQIASSKASGFPTMVKESEVIVPQIDLYKIWHFDNKAKSTSLKLLEFNMRSKTIEDLPFPVGTVLTSEQIDKLISYNWHDVKETLQFYNFSITQIKFREELSERYGRNFMNHNDTKIGKDYFVMRLEEAGIKPYTYVNNRREWKQTPRPHIDIKDHLFNYYDFERPETKAVFEWFSKQRIRETKGVFTEIPEHELGELAKYATMRTIERKLSVPRLETPTALQLENFKLEYPMGWIETRPLAQYFQKKQLMSYWRVWRIADTLNVVMDGFQFDFGTGGIHGSITDKVVRRTAKYDIIDADV